MTDETVEIFEEFGEAEALIAAAESAEQAGIEGNVSLPRPLDQEEDRPISETAKKKARGILSAMEKFFSMRLAGFAYGEDKYDKAEKELAPLLDKYELSNSGPLKYLEEANGVFFLGGTFMESVGHIKAQAQEEEQTTKQPVYSQGQPAEHGQVSEPFTT